MSAENHKKTISHKIPGYILCVVLLLGLYSGLGTVFSDSGLSLIKSTQAYALLNGITTADLSKMLNQQLVGGKFLATFSRLSDWLLLKDLGPQVRRGCRQWLFLREELDVHPHPQANMRQRAKIVGRLAQDLAKQQIHLLTVVIPDKSRIESKYLCSLTRPTALHHRLSRFNQLIQVQNVDVIDLSSIFASLSGERYFRSDTHWNEQSAQNVAYAIARHLLDQGKLSMGETSVEIKTGKYHERIGDLIRLAGLDEVSAPFRPRGDWVTERIITVPTEPSDDLLGEMTPPSVVVVGSSFSRNANFIGFLSDALRMPAADMAKDGAKFIGSIKAYLDNPAFRETPPKVIVWEIPERVVDAPLDKQEKEWLARLSKGQ